MFHWLKSRYTRSLELRIEELKITHAKELEYVKTELAWHKEEVERLRRFLMPSMQPVYDQSHARSQPESAAPTIPEEEQGTPFQRLVMRDLKQQEEEEKQAQLERTRRAEDAEKKKAETVSAKS